MCKTNLLKYFLRGGSEKISSKKEIEKPLSRTSDLPTFHSGSLAILCNCVSYTVVAVDGAAVECFVCGWRIEL
jgi:hypothetical protein